MLKMLKKLMLINVKFQISILDFNFFHMDPPRVDCHAQTLKFVKQAEMSTSWHLMKVMIDIVRAERSFTELLAVAET